MATRIVILGGGFAGLNTARHLLRLCRNRRSDLRITLVSRDNYFTMTPLLFEAGSGILEPRHAVNPIRPMFEHGSAVQFVEAEITDIDFDRRIVHAQLVEESPFEIGFDHLVIGLGGITNTKLVPGSEHAMKFKTLADAIYLRNHTIERFERADVEKDPAKKHALLTFVIVGAGLVGTELQGELSDFLHHVCRQYPNVEPSMLRFELIEAGPRIMPEMDEDLATYATDIYRGRGINVRVNMPVKSIEPGKVTLSDGEVIESETIIIATGVAPSPLIAKLDLPKERKGRIDVEPTMRVKGRDNIWALGDCAAIPDPTGKPYPALAQHALREARTLAANIVAALDGQPLAPFVYRSLGTLAALGRFKGVGRVMNLKLRGFVAWFVWRSYYLMQMPRWSRRLRIMIDWTVALLFSYDVVELELTQDRKISKLDETNALQQHGAPR